MCISFSRYGVSIPFMDGKIETLMDYCYTDILNMDWTCDDCLGDCEICHLEEEGGNFG